MRRIALLAALVLIGCRQPEFNPHPPVSEEPILSNITQLTRGFDRAGEAYFSQDMQWMIFQAAPKGEQLYQMFIASIRYENGEIVALNNPLRISPENSRNTCGWFSRDGTTMIFSSTVGKEVATEPAAGYQQSGRDYRWSYPDGMEIYRADGWQGALSAAEPGAIANLAKHPLTDNNAYDAEGSISPDGKWIAFTSNRTGDLELWAMKIDGTSPVQLTNIKGQDGGAFFSPDGRKLVYRSDRAGNNLLQIFISDVVYDASGNITGLKNEKQLTNDANVNWTPFFHPDGKHIVYACSGTNHSNYDLWLMRTDGSRKTRITFKPGADVLGAFSPDGKYLVWSSKRTEDNTTQVFIAKFALPKGS